jgi:3-dehydroquinate dehydratase/shikimate dehydrogenase
MAELRRKRDEADDADLVELRLDTVADPDVAGALAGRRCPAIVTCRPAWEGGSFAGSEEERRRLLADAVELGAEYVDLEWRGRFDELIARRGGRGVVLSSHDFEGTSPDLAAQLQAMRSSGAEVVKIAVTARKLSDCIALLDVGAQAGRQGGLVLIAMGDYGLSTRVLAARFGSMWSYAGGVSDIGQITAESLLKDYRFRTLSETTSVYGLVGGSIGHSVSPAMHNAAFRVAQLNAVYLPWPATSADDFVTFGRALGIKGASVTIPHKVSLFERMDDLDAVARRIGAINTIRAGDDGRWTGGNTDASGFLQPLQERVSLNGMRAAVLGAGGAARAVSVALAASGCAIRIHARDAAKAKQTAALTSADVGPWPPGPGTWDLLINCTPIGMHPNADETPLPKAALTGRCVYDLVYNPQVTRLLREAATAGCLTIGGLEMLVAQAHEQFQSWTGSTAPSGVMGEAALKELSRLAESARDENHVV